MRKIENLIEQTKKQPALEPSTYKTPSPSQRSRYMEIREMLNLSSELLKQELESLTPKTPPKQNNNTSKNIENVIKKLLGEKKQNLEKKQNVEKQQKLEKRQKLEKQQK